MRKWLTEFRALGHRAGQLSLDCESCGMSWYAFQDNLNGEQTKPCPQAEDNAKARDAALNAELEQVKKEQSETCTKLLSLSIKEAELKMALGLIMLLCVLFVAAPAHASSMQLLANDGQPIKQAWRDRHPRLYKCYRGARHACIIAKPFIEVAGSACQVVQVFL